MPLYYKKALFTLLIFVFLWSFSDSTLAQNGRILTLDDYSYEYIQRLQMRGKMLQLSPTSLPYTYGEVQEVINENKAKSESWSQAEQKWFEMIRKRVEPVTRPDNAMGTELTIATRLSDTKRQEEMRPFRQDLFVYPYPSLAGFIQKGAFTGQLNLYHDYYLDQDPVGLDAARRLYMRAQDSYLGYHKEGVSIYLGRFQNQWGMYNQSSAFLSTNAHSFDQLNMELRGKYFSFQSILGELDALNTNGFFTGSGTINRYIATHRLNWHPSRFFRMSFFESVIYSGQNSGISLKYANPLLALGFVTDNAPKNTENNLMMGGGLWFQLNNLTMNGQILLDDLEHTNDFGEPITFTVLGSANYSLTEPFIDLGFEFEAVAYQTYNTDQAEGRYLYLGRGLATQHNDYFYTRLDADVFLDHRLRGLKITPYISYLAQGEQEINQPFNRRNPDGTVIDVILSGTEEITWRGGMHVLYQPRHEVWFELDTGYNLMQNVNHLSGNTKNRWVTLARVGLRLVIYGEN